ncbi:hypothetical protein B7P34_24520 [Streptosporangium nondiastaticum]|uniref:Secreted protein n=1 Tax=Streptosporangium nondiastaticum TaxID=35764 RepID=A0A9X7JM84_9ACTN|nr:hypothetical protein [Streptosporangium nondiastaticum]PSJ26113.1 hypothetical protein B7P34_24520 [Streptosporangium nondiastaticum]
MPARKTALALAAAALVAVPLAAGCSTAQKAVDCARLGIEISDDVDDLQRSVTDTASDTDNANKILDNLEKDTKKLKDKSSNVDVGKALDHLQKAVGNVRDALRDDKTPDLTPVTDAAGELSKVCTSK